MSTKAPTLFEREREKVLLVDGNKTCIGCSEEKPPSEFGMRSTGRPYTRCRPCRNLQRRQYRKKNPERHRELDRAYYERNKEQARNYNLVKLYGITIEQYDEMVEEQDGVCALCGSPPTGRHNGGRLHVDHDHDTGLIRKLLCYHCNNGLGRFKDDPDLLRLAAAYIEEFR